MATSHTTPPVTPSSRPDGTAVPAGTARKRAATGTRPAPKRRSKIAAQTPGQSSAGAVHETAGQPSGQPVGQRLSDAERQRRIAEAAYRKAEQRGFAGDRQLEDWLEAEREHYQAASIDHEDGSR